MPRLVCDGREVGPAEVAFDRRRRARGLLGRDGLDGALVLPGVRGVHTFGMRFPIDVAFLGGDGRVVGTVRMQPRRLGRPRLRARSVVEAEAGAFAGWGLEPGVHVEVTG